MRVIAGEAKGCKLVAPKGNMTRPTPERAREALFSSWLSCGPLGAGLDAFAGSGAIGIEALSRGAPAVFFAEQDREALLALRANLRGLPAELAAKAQLCAGPYARALAQLAEQPSLWPLGWVYADPPFAAGLYDGFLAACGAHDGIDQHTSLVLEHASKQPPPSHASWRCERSRKFGSVALSFYRRVPAGGSNWRENAGMAA